MMRRWVILVGIVALAELVVGVGAFASFLATGSGEATASTRSDWLAPTTSVAIGISSGRTTGSISQGGTYYVFADATDDGGPASGVGSMSADLSSITTGASSVPMTAGSFLASGHTYAYRSAQLTASTPLAGGSVSFSVTSVDNASNSETQTASVTIDNSVPAPTLTSSPPASTSSTSASFGFSDTEGGVAFECALDGIGAFSSCASPQSYSDLSVAAHTFSVRARDDADNIATTTYDWTIVATGLDHLSVTAPTGATAGTGFSVTVTAKDAANATFTGYRGTVSFSSNDTQAVFPANYTFTVADNGAHTFTGVILKTVGATRTVAVADGPKTASSTVNVTAGAGTTLRLANCINNTTPVTCGNSFTIGTKSMTANVELYDAYGNAVSTATSITITLSNTTNFAVSGSPANVSGSGTPANRSSTFTVSNTSGSNGVTATVTLSATGYADLTFSVTK